jgi:hypothetical protein
MHNTQGNGAIEEAVTQHWLLLKGNADEWQKGQEEGSKVDVVRFGRCAHRLHSGKEKKMNEQAPECGG